MTHHPTTPLHSTRLLAGQKKSIQLDSGQAQSVTSHGVASVCAAPEVLVNGSPSPDIAGTVSGGDFTSIEEIQFVGMVNTADPRHDGVKQRRICKIKCLNGVWIGPLCAFENGEFPLNLEHQMEARESLTRRAGFEQTRHHRLPCCCSIRE